MRSQANPAYRFCSRESGLATSLPCPRSSVREFSDTTPWHASRQRPAGHLRVRPHQREAAAGGQPYDERMPGAKSFARRWWKIPSNAPRPEPGVLAENRAWPQCVPHKAIYRDDRDRECSYGVVATNSRKYELRLEQDRAEKRRVAEVFRLLNCGMSPQDLPRSRLLPRATEALGLGEALRTLGLPAACHRKAAV